MLSERLRSLFRKESDPVSYGTPLAGSQASAARSVSGSGLPGRKSQRKEAPSTRQSRGLSLVSVVGAVALVRFAGFASTVFGVKFPPALALQYVALIAVFGFGLSAISRGAIIEPPTFITNMVAILTERLTRRLALS